MTAFALKPRLVGERGAARVVAREVHFAEHLVDQLANRVSSWRVGHREHLLPRNVADFERDFESCVLVYPWSDLLFVEVMVVVLNIARGEVTPSRCFIEKHICFPRAYTVRN